MRFSKSVNVLLIIILTMFSTVSFAGVLQTEIQLAQPVQDMDYSPTNNLLAVATNSQIEIYTNKLQLISTLPRVAGQSAEVASVSWDPNGQWLAVDNEPNVEIWKYDTVTQVFIKETTISASKS
jgi:WD40 repeat protein